MVLAQKQTHRSVKQNRKPRNEPTNGVGKTGQQHAKERSWDHFLFKKIFFLMFIFEGEERA